ncbi:transporter substrate-binding domain-containing protein [Anaerotignum sp. MB30-C6]|uniref:transporter substrate-binding domain-containing protein n=1 Tax=Anaerotignum sp. MB30-C6 TaxID=3070814 RepID=UPI0027DE9110|nr:transporter substrate-binding domain-containing protein [Anaerotignum sp. MB30-C6]WMI82209.1 transporter substrate-binding domain-containing protein [Anaerotignum sp. MB30-C6]
MKTKARKLRATLLSFIILFVSTLPVLGNERVKIRVGFFESPNFQQVEEDGSLSGYSYDYLQAIAQYTGWEYEFITASTFSECLDLLKNGEIDIMGFLLKTPQRQEVYEYANLPSGISMSLLVTDKENQNLAYEDFESFHGMTVGIQEGLARNAGFQKYCEENGFMVRTIVYSSIEEVLAAMQTNQVDAALISSNQNSPESRIIAKFDINSVYYATTKGNTKVLNELNHALERIKAASPTFDDNLYRKHFEFTDGQPAVLSREEMLYLKEHPTVQILYDVSWAPFETVNADGIPRGIAIDVIKEAASSVGMNLEFISSNNQEEKKALISSGEYDVLPAITYNYQWANHQNVYITQPYIHFDYMVVYKVDVDDKDHVALPKGYYITEAVGKMVDENDTISYYDTMEDCIEAVNKGEVDYTYANSYEAEYYMTIPKYRLLQFRTVQGLSQQLSVGVSMDKDPLLFSIITKGLSSISQEEMRNILRKHINHRNDSNFLDMMYTNPDQFFGIVFGMLIILGAYFSIVCLYRMKDKQNELLQTANKAKSDFLSHMSHDMRTPMNAVIGMSSLGMECKELEKSKEYHEKVYEASQYLLRLINDTLDMSIIENNKIRLNLEPYSYHEFIQGIETVIHERASKKGVIFQTQIHADFQETAMFDKLRLQQIFINLINNAIKFTPRGGRVDFIIGVAAIRPERIKAQFVIRDNGVGMSQTFQGRMFEPFEQERFLDSGAYGGTGLGLSIVKQLVDLMGGTIQCKSQIGVGTEFIVEIETDIAQGESISTGRYEETIDEDKLVGKRILLCEDNFLNTLIAKTFLEKKGCLVDHGGNGRAGVDLFANSPVGHYDAILMDIRMPFMTGLEATSLIRSLPRADATSVLIIAMTANSFDEDIHTSLEVGMNAHLSKPIDAKKLFSTLVLAMENRK